jgi:hypothetical protein
MPNSDLYLMYQLTDSSETILRLTDGAFIPRAPGNRDYREYLDWLEEGNTPLPAPEPPAPGPDYQAFWDALLISPVYQEIRSQAITTPGVLVACTEFIAAVTDAKAGRPNVPAIQACIDNLLAAGSFSTEDLEAIGGLLVVGNLQDSFTLG